MTRLPILDGKSAKSIVHRATINEYLADRAINAGSVEKCTLADLLAEDADALDKSYVAVPPDATIEEAMALMNGEAGAQDVFVIDRRVGGRVDHQHHVHRGMSLRFAQRPEAKIKDRTGQFRLGSWRLAHPIPFRVDSAGLHT